jgi:glycogen debranching enzyme
VTSPWTLDAAPTRGGDEVTLMEGTTFCISDHHGDIGAQRASGLFVRDTRVLETWRLRLAGRRLEGLRVHQDDAFGARFVLLSRAPADLSADGPASDVLVVRERFVGDGMREDLTLRNTRRWPTRVDLELTVAADFGDLFEVKEGVATAGPAPVRRTGAGLVLQTSRGGADYAVTVLVGEPECGGDEVLRWSVELAGHASWSTTIQVVPTVRGRELVPHHAPGVPAEHAEPARRHRSFRAATPRLTTVDRALTDVLARSIDDLGTLRIFDPDRPGDPVIAAGAPWFMALFGRDALLTSIMLAPMDTSLALGTLASLGARMGVRDDAASDEQPGKVPHEIRFGPAGSSLVGGGNAYYGSVDATPLFVMAVGEVARWAPSRVDPALVAAADRALTWVRGPGDPDGDGLVERERSSDHGLVNQGWKDSADGVNHADGTLARGPIALAEVQGYTYAAYLARAEIADVMGEADTAHLWRTRAAQLHAAFESAFWLPERGWYATGLDRDKKPVDALTSNIGHCLWTGIVSDEHAGAVAAHLMSPAMWTGFGIRTLARGMGAYDPMSYHNGSVWPHDSALCVAGLRRYGFDDEAAQVALGLLDAAHAFGGRLPELFSGFDRADEPAPVPFPSACSPQAWAAAAPFLLLTTLLGLRAGDEGLDCDPAVPDRLRPLHLGNVACRGRTYDIDVDDRGWRISAAATSGQGGRP